MLRNVTIFVAGSVFGTAFGVALGFFFFPFVFPPPEAMESLTSAERTAVVADGDFIHANPSDPVHYGKGHVTVYQGIVYLSEEFEVGPGPKFHVYMVPKAPIRRSSDLDGAAFVDLGRLRSFKGSQKYPIPAGTNPADYQSIIIWCEKFGVLISPADLKAAG